MSGADLATSARALVGVSFRQLGRDPTCGLDCLGVPAAALAAIGRPASLPASYPLRRRGNIDANAIAGQAGLFEAHGPVMPGDVLLVRCSTIQFHLLIAVSAERFVHAHAGLGRVVIGACDPSWPIVGRWRLPQTS